MFRNRVASLGLLAALSGAGCNALLAAVSAGSATAPVAGPASGTPAPVATAPGAPPPVSPAPSDAGNLPGGQAAGLVEVTIKTSVLRVNFSAFDPLFGPSFGAGSAMARLRIFARFCEDPGCARPVAVVPAEVAGADASGYYVFGTASNEGKGFDKELIFRRAPLGKSYLQLVGDTEFSAKAGKGKCTGLSDCPGDADLLQVATVTPPGGAGKAKNPASFAREIEISAPGETLSLEGPQFLGHIFLGGSELWSPAPADPGRLVAAVSNAEDTFRNYVALIDPSDPAGKPGDASYVMTNGGAALQGDLCGLVEGRDALYAIAVTADGAYILALDPATGRQKGTTPVAGPIPPGDPGNATTYPFPCRGVYVEKGVTRHLYLLQFRGAGSQPNQYHALYHVDLGTGAVETPLDAYGKWAWRGLVATADGSKLVALDMSWSQQNIQEGPKHDRLIPIPLGPDGKVGGVDASKIVDTGLTSDDRCGATVNWPSDIAVAKVGGEERILVGHDAGVATFEPATLARIHDLDLTTFGTLVGQIAVAPGGKTLYAVPQCKAYNARHDWTLPYGASTERADKNLAAALEPGGANLAVASTGIDVNGDGSPDNGIDLDFYRIKAFIRSFGTTLPIPPVAFTAPRVAVGEKLMFLRGTGIQGDGGGTISSSGLGQAQDIAILDRFTGKGHVGNRYMPFFDGLSSNAGAGPAIWGYDIWPGRETSVGFLHYIPATASIGR
ncbi:MAG: hypothetical protein FJZ01_17485 [Candidatus Sericytochromatia bacterium]|nr:hypothetical protein [Candidatus Tanganyikabacteria bacterium]